MKEKKWFIKVDLDEEPELYAEVSTWMAAVFKLLEVIEKGVPFTCAVDFFYRDGE